MPSLDDLQIDVSVEVDTSDLELIINTFSGDEIMDPLAELAKEFRDGIHKGVTIGAKQLADHARSLQELYIGLNGTIASDALLNSIKVTSTGEHNYKIGTTISHFYPLCIEYGRGPVEPVKANVLHYYTLSGTEVFTKYSRAYKGKPYVQPAFNEVERDAVDTLWRCIADATN